MNEAQRLLLQHYENGEYAESPEAEIRSHESVGDGLLRFLFIELSEREDCDSLATAADRMDTVLRQVSDVCAAIHAAADAGASMDGALDAGKAPVDPAPGQ